MAAGAEGTEACGGHGVWLWVQVLGVLGSGGDFLLHQVGFPLSH